MELNRSISHLFRFLKRRIVGFSEIFASLAIAGLSAGLLAEYHFLFDLCTHFRIQAMVALLICGLLLISLARKKWFGCLSLAIGLGIAGTILPWFVGKPSPKDSADRIRITSFNVLTSNPSKDLVGDYILAESPDIVILYEVDQKWKEAMAGKLSSIYPHRIVSPRVDNFGIAAFSKQAFTSAEITTFGDNGLPSVDLFYEVQGVGPVRIIGTHPIPPTKSDYWHSRNIQFNDIAENIAQNTIPTILCGDLNCTPWSPFLKRLMKKARLEDSAKGFGIRPTWSAISFVFGLPIDHIFQTASIKVLDRKIGPGLGSDHRAVTVDFNLKPVVRESLDQID